MNKTRKITLFILISFMIAIFTTGCSGPTGTNNQSGPPNGIVPNGAGSQIPPAGIPDGLASDQNNPQNLPVSNEILSNTLAGNGTVTAGTYAKLYFGSAGKVADIKVKDGMRISKGTVLAQLDTLSLEAGVDQAKKALNASKLSQIEANSTLSTAKVNLELITDVRDIQDDITKAEWDLEIAQMQADESRALDNEYSSDYWNSMIWQISANVAQKQRELADLLGDEEYSVFAYAYGQKYDRLIVENARIKELAVESAQQLVTQSQDDIDLAQKNLEIAIQQLNEATIAAPFDGIIIKVYPKAGDYLGAPSQAADPVIYMIDPSTMQLEIKVNELDMPLIKMNQEAIVNINAFPNESIKGSVTEISLSPVNTGGVYYTVTVSFLVPENLDIQIGMNGSATLKVE